MLYDLDVFNSRESAARSYCRAFPVIFKEAKGSLLTDVDNKTYIDFLAGCSSLNYGHNDPDMKNDLLEYIGGDGIAHGLDMHTNAKALFIETFQRHILEPRRFDHRMLFTGPTGANAVEAALKLARKVTGRTNVIAFTNGFHGVTMGALAATANSYHRGGAGTDLGQVTRVPYDGYMGANNNTCDLLENLLNDKSSGVDAPAAFLLETIQGEGGLNAASKQWVRRIAHLAKSSGALLIIDDVQAGCGRSGSFFSFDAFEVEPDIITMAKSLSGFGLPMALALVKPEFDCLGPGEHNGTFRGNNHAFVTARTAIKKFWSAPEFQETLCEKENIIEKGLKAISNVIEGSRLKGRGLFRGLDVHNGEVAANICRRAFEDGLILETSGAEDQVLKVLAPLTTPNKLLKEGLEIILNAAISSQNSNSAAAE